MKIPEFRIEEFTLDDNFEKQGGQAKVYKGFHSSHGDIAIKKWFSASNNMKMEMELLKQNAYHQNIIQFLGILINSKFRCIGYVMPYMPMGSLEDIIHGKSKQYDQEQIKSWITQICYGLSYLHGKQIIHRDIKPSNVLLGRCYDDVKLSDFGAARSLDNITSTLTKGFNEPIKRPYDRTTGTLDFMNKIIQGERPQLGSNLSKEESELLMRCWNADPHKRPTIDYVREFCSTTTFSLIDLKNSLYESVPSLRNLNIHNSNEMFSKTITALNDDERPPIPPRLTSRRLFPNEIEKSPSNCTTSYFHFQEEQTIILLGGEDENKILNTLLMLENNGQNWKELDIGLPYAINNHGAQFLNSNIYVFGGYNEEEGVLNSTYKLSENLQWEKMADMNQKRYYISNSNVILNNQIWVCGGWDGEEGPLTSVEMYDPLTNKWKYMKQMHHSRFQAAAAVVNGKIFCCGGSDGGNKLNSLECYDPSSNVWTLICDMPESISAHGAVEINGNFIVMGGRSFTKDLNNVWALDATDKNAEWIEKPFMYIPRSYFSIAKIYDKIFICGGAVIEDNIWKASDDVEIFVEEVWTDGPKMQTHRQKATAVVIPMEFAKKLIKDNIITAENLYVHNNNESLIQNQFKNSNENVVIPDLIESFPEEETILLLGGSFNGWTIVDSIVMLENNGQNWKELNIKLPYPICGHGAQFLNNNIYIFGGFSGDKELNSTYKLAKSLKWEKMADMNKKRYGISKSSVILNNQIWICGGHDGKEKLRSVEMYDLLTNKWKYMRQMNECRRDAAATVVNGKIFCCDGWDNSTECYDPSSDAWTLVSNMPQLIEHHGAVEIDGTFIVIGTKNVWELDTTDEDAVWIEKPSISAPRRDFSIAKIRGKIFVCGGKGGERSTAESIDQDAWKRAYRTVFADVNIASQLEAASRLLVKSFNDVKIFDGEVWWDGPKMPTARSNAPAVVTPMRFARDLKQFTDVPKGSRVREVKPRCPVQ